jgi:hypothetical protein
MKPMTDKLITMEPKTALYLFVECCSDLINIQNFLLLVICIHEVGGP